MFLFLKTWLLHCSYRGIYARFNLTRYHAPPGTYPRKFAVFFFPGGLFPPPGTRETIPHPEPSINLIYVVLATSFLEHYWVPSETHMGFSFRRITTRFFLTHEKIHSKAKRKKWRKLLARTLHKNTGLNRCLFICIKNIVSLYMFWKLSYHLAGLKKYFFVSFAKNPIRVRIIPIFV